MGDLYNFLDLIKSQCPPPQPPTRKIELIRTEVNVLGPCCACKKIYGKLTCGRCKAIKYCGQQCQREGSMMEGWHGWKDHKKICNKIKKHTEETKAAIDQLAEEFGGTDNLLQSPLVKKGLFDYKDITAELMGEPPAKASNVNEEYILARMRLTEAYVKCGEEASSCTAFMLAAENMLDILCLTYSLREGEHVKYTYCGWMVAAGMDQLALDYLCYFRHRLMSPHSLPYLDLSREEDIEGESYLKLFKEKKNYMDWAADMWFHDYMLIALIKYKRLQSLIVQRNKDVKKCVMEDTILERINQLDTQIKQILSDVNACNPMIIPGIIDRDSIPEKDEALSDEQSGYIHDASWAVQNYEHAWNMSPAYIKVLEYFLQTGHVMPTFKKLEDSLGKKLGCFPVGGLLQAAFDVDPTRCYGRGDDLGLEGLVPYGAFNLEFAKEDIGKEKEKKKGNVAPKIGKEMQEEVTDLIAKETQEEATDFIAKETQEEVTDFIAKEKQDKVIDLKAYSKVCWYCSKEDAPLYKCGCRKARYCTKECQEEDWAVHGSYCLKKQELRKVAGR